MQHSERISIEFFTINSVHIGIKINHKLIQQFLVFQSTAIPSVLLRHVIVKSNFERTLFFVFGMSVTNYMNSRTL